MLLEYTGLPKRTLNALKNKGIVTTTDVLRTFPRKYLDYRNIVCLKDSIGLDRAVCVSVLTTEKKTGNPCSVIKLKGVELITGNQLFVSWFGNAFMWERIKSLKGIKVVFCGKVNFDPRFGYSMSNPTFFFEEEKFKGKMYPVYPKIKGVSEEQFKKTLDLCFSYANETLTNEIIRKEGIMGYIDSLKAIHTPKDTESLKRAKNRFMLDDLTYFTLNIKRIQQQDSTKSKFIAARFNKTKEFLKSMPFNFTEDQKKAINGICRSMNAGERTQALIQGDVGCGKTMVAFSTMICAAENGYQSVIMVPTSALAKQHYEELMKYADMLGFKVAYISGDLTAKEKRETQKKIKTGEVDMIVGTHSCISDSTEYNNLGLVVIDEEHRFGVKQREALNNKASKGVHVIWMSATPIPRTTASIKYGDNIKIYTIKTMPNGRIPIQTAINNSQNTINSFALKQLQAGRQIYVICPRIEDIEESTRDLYSADEAYKDYMRNFEPYGYKVGLVTGKQKKNETESVLNAFSNNEIQILVSTTVIEVGVNVPNASLIIINNAELFGLAQLHQLRGRVGRGTHKSYCILKSKDRENQRLNTLCQTTDGFEIAEKDLELRGSGNLIGEEQSGFHYYTNLAITMPTLYEKAIECADELIREDEAENFLYTYEEGKAAR